MEKYTIDIDKVLDEFEETEALKIHVDKKSEEHVIEHCLSPNRSTNLEEKCTVNSWIGTAFDINTSRVDKASTLPEIDSISDTNTSLPQGNIKVSDEHLSSSLHCGLEKEINFSCTNKAAASFNKTEVLYNDDVNVKHLSYDIFYKTRESDSSLSQDKCNHSQTLNCSSEFFSNEYVLGDYSPDEILCVSVEENKPDISVDESHVKDAESHSAYNSVQSSDTSKENHSESEILGQPEILPSTEEGTLLDIQKSRTKSEFNNSEDSEKLSHPNPIKISPEQLFLKDIKLGKTMVEEIEGGSKDVSFLHSQHGSYLQVKEDELKVVSELVSCNAEKQSTNSRSLDDCLNPISRDNNNFEVCNNLDAHNCEMEDVQLNIEDVFRVCDAEVPRNALDIQNGFSVQDDDSGVSSTEDISGNSPPQINSGSANSVVNENCDIKESFSSLDPHNKASNTSDVSNLMTNFKSSVVSSSIPQADDEKIQQHETLLCCEEGASSMPAVENVIISSVNNNTGFQYNYSNNDISRQLCNSEIGIIMNEEMKFSEANSVISSDDTNISETINKGENNKCNFESGNSVTMYDSENQIQQYNVSQVETNCTKLENSSPSYSTSEGNDEKCVSEVIDQNSMDEETVECTEDLNLTLDTNYCISPRLQRPTTLDLPTLLIPTSETHDETMDQSNSNNEQLIAIDVSADTSVVEPCSAEMIPYIRQQPQIGIVKPYWIPDSEALNCMHCGMKFTVLKRRHHCRGCGKVLCSRCCNQKAYLTYLNKEDRICQPCADILASTLQIDQIPVPFDSQSSSSCGSSPNFSPSPQMPSSNYGDKNMWRPHPNNPDDYCSTIPPLQQIQSSGTRPPPTVMVPIGVLKRGNKPRKEPKQVIFSDGIRPGGDLTDLTEPVETAPVYRRIGRKRVDKMISGDAKLGTGSLSPVTFHHKGRQKRIIVSDGDGPLPPVVLQKDNENDEKVDWNQIFQKLQDDGQKPVNFALMKNMHLFVKITKLVCCFGNECWCFTSHGLCTVGQDEVMVIMERLPGENTIPRDIFKLFSQVYDSASKGATFDDLGHIIFPEQILGSSDHRGFLFVRPTFQCLSKLTVPNTPYLVAILIHKWEVPWAKVFPLRLMLRMGAECRYYPCSLVSVRHRKPVYFEIGQTIMSVLADLRNFQFTIPVISGLVVHMEEKKTCVNIPRNRYEKVMKVLNSNNVEHVLALGSNFSTEADSHLVCMQKEEGDYQTQAINIENTARKVTGASFIVFSGALKSTSGLSAKFSIVEDGLLIQISQETMVALHMALRDMRDLTIACGQINAEPEEIVMLQWTRDDKKFNIGVQSPIDGKSFEGVSNIRIHSATDYASESYLIRWTEVFFLDIDDNASSIQNELVDPSRLAETVAQSCCMALTPYLDQLAESELTKLGLRVTLDSQSDRVEYDIGARGKALPALYMNALDSGLIPVILRLSSSTHSEKLSFELIFHILIK